MAVGMVPVSMPALKPGAVIHGPKAMTDTLLGDFAREIQSRGFKVAGLIQRNGDAGDDCACVMELIDLGSGDRSGFRRTWAPAPTPAGSIPAGSPKPVPGCGYR